MIDFLGRILEFCYFNISPIFLILLTIFFILSLIFFAWNYVISA